MTDTVGKTPKPAGPFSLWEVGLALRYLRAKRKEGGIALIAIISYVAVALAVMALIVVMSIMAGFRAELLILMLSFNENRNSLTYKGLIKLFRNIFLYFIKTIKTLIYYILWNFILKAISGSSLFI